MNKFFESRTLAVIAGATLLAVVSGSSGAVAAGLVTSADIKNQTVRSRDIGQNSINSSELGPDAVYKHHVRGDSIGFGELLPTVTDKIDRVNNLDGRIDDLGDRVTDLKQRQNFLMIRLEEAPALPDYSVNVHYTRQDGTDLGKPIPAGEVKQLTANCETGNVALGGGFNNGNTQPGSDLTVLESHPSGLTQMSNEEWGAAGWSVTLQNSTDQAQHASVYTICADVNARIL